MTLSSLSRCPPVVVLVGQGDHADCTAVRYDHKGRDWPVALRVARTGGSAAKLTRMTAGLQTSDLRKVQPWWARPSSVTSVRHLLRSVLSSARCEGLRQ